MNEIYSLINVLSNLISALLRNAFKLGIYNVRIAWIDALNSQAKPQIFIGKIMPQRIFNQFFANKCNLVKTHRICAKENSWVFDFEEDKM